MNARRHLGVSALVALAVIGWVLVGPSQLGGPVTYVAVSGTSMEPQLHTGDLVIVRKASSYDVGDVVAYKNPQLNSTVLHRISKIEDDRYVLKGDNNDFVDTYKAGPDEIVGRRWIVLGGAGRIVQLLRSPVGAAVIVMLIAFIAMSSTGKRRGNGKKESIPARGPRSGSWLQVHHHVLVSASAAAAALFLLLGVIAFDRSTTETKPTKLPFTEAGHFSYGGDAKRGAVYPTGRLESGRPVYLQLVKDVDFSFEYHFESETPHEIHGTGSLRAVVSDGNGWSHSIVLSRKEAFTGDRWATSGTVHLAPVRALMHDVESSTGVVRDFYTLSVVPSVHVDGRMDGSTFTSSFESPLAFQVGALEMQLAPSTDPSGPSGGDALRPSQGGAAIASSDTTASLSMPGLTLDVSKARLVAAIGLLLSLALLALTLSLGRAEGKSEVERIEDAYGRLMVPVRSVTTDREAALVTVAGMDALAGLARRYDRVILHEERAGMHRYVVENDGTVYSYECWDARRDESRALLRVAADAGDAAAASDPKAV